jgi:hypothetical protein
VTWPFARLTADADTIVLVGWLGGLKVMRTDDVYIAVHDGVTAKGLRFYPADGAPAVTFWTGHREELRLELERLGWLVEDVPQPED